MASRDRPRTRRRALEEGHTFSNNPGANKNIFETSHSDELGSNPRDILFGDLKFERDQVEDEDLPLQHNHLSTTIKTEFNSEADNSFSGHTENNILLEEVKPEPVEQKVLINHYEEIILSDSSSDSEIENDDKIQSEFEESNILDKSLEIIDYSHLNNAEVSQLTDQPKTSQEFQDKSEIKLEQKHVPNNTKPTVVSDNEDDIDFVDSNKLEDKILSVAENNDEISNDLPLTSPIECNNDNQDADVQNLVRNKAHNVRINNSWSDTSSDSENEEGEIVDSDNEKTPENLSGNSKSSSANKFKKSRSSFAVINEWIGKQDKSNSESNSITQQASVQEPSSGKPCSSNSKTEDERSSSTKISRKDSTHKNRNYRSSKRSLSDSSIEDKRHNSKTSRRRSSLKKENRSHKSKRSRCSYRSKRRGSSDSSTSRCDSRKRDRSPVSESSSKISSSKGKRSHHSKTSRRHSKNKRSYSRSNRKYSTNKDRRSRSTKTSSRSRSRSKHRRSPKSREIRSDSISKNKRYSDSSIGHCDSKRRARSTESETGSHNSKSEHTGSHLKSRGQDSKSPSSKTSSHGSSRSPDGGSHKLKTSHSDSRNKGETFNNISPGEAVTPPTSVLSKVSTSKPNTPERDTANFESNAYIETRNLKMQASPEMVSVTLDTQIHDANTTIDISDDEIMIIDDISSSNVPCKRRRKSSGDTQIIGERSPSSSPNRTENKISSPPTLPNRSKVSPKCDEIILPNLVLTHKDGLGKEVLVCDPTTDPITYHEGKFTGIHEGRKVQIRRRDGQIVDVDVFTMNNFNAVVQNMAPSKPGNLRTGHLVLYREKDFQFGVGTVRKSSLEHYRGKSVWTFEIKPFHKVPYTITTDVQEVRTLTPPWLNKVFQTNPHFKRHFNVPRHSKVNPPDYNVNAQPGQ